MAPFENGIDHSIDGRCRHGDDRIARQRCAVDAQHAAPFVHQRAARLADVELHVRTNQ